MYRQDACQAITPANGASLLVPLETKIWWCTPRYCGDKGEACWVSQNSYVLTDETYDIFDLIVLAYPAATDHYVKQFTVSSSIFWSTREFLVRSCLLVQLIAHLVLVNIIMPHTTFSRLSNVFDVKLSYRLSYQKARSSNLLLIG